MTSADILETWRDHLADGRRRSPHTVRAYLAAAKRLLFGRRALLELGFQAKLILLARAIAPQPESQVSGDARPFSDDLRPCGVLAADDKAGLVGRHIGQRIERARVGRGTQHHAASCMACGQYAGAPR